MTVIMLRDFFNAERTAYEVALIDALRPETDRLAVLPEWYHIPPAPSAQAAVLAFLQPLAGPVIIFSWLYPRPAEQLWRLMARESMKKGVQPDFFDMKAFATPVAAARAFMTAHPRSPGKTMAEVERLDGAVDPSAPRWYPVIDSDRCTACGQCSAFCLFDVYERQAKTRRVQVARPDQCKPGCPACSRICPEGAIMFPLSDDPAIAGAPGHLMRPDPATKAAYYRRTGQSCPVCGRVHAVGPAEQGIGPVCRECGQPATPDVAAGSPETADLDALIDDLEALLDP